MTRTRWIFAVVALCGFLLVMTGWGLKSRLKPHLGRVPGDLLIAAAMDRSPAGRASLVLDLAAPRVCGSATPFALTVHWRVAEATAPWVQVWIFGENGNPVLWHATAAQQGDKATEPWVGRNTVFLLVAGNTGKLLASARADDLPCIQG